jgi:light-regulated signal transduction histidine kinase (bacteriophytochrome)
MHSTELDSITAELLQAAVHDLKGPAGRLRMLSQLVSRASSVDEDTRRLLGYIEDSAAAVGIVADGLRTYSEICGRARSLRPVDLAQAAAAAMTNVRAEMEKSGGEIQVSPLPHVEADAFLVTWLFQELLTNAMRFRTGTPPKIAVSCGEDGPAKWFVSVKDNGPGIGADMADRVFRPFKKIVASSGAGLGLTICRKIVEMHGGRIWVEPADSGADLRFFLGGVEARQCG